MVYYRKYRPQQIKDLDLISVRDRLTSILSSKDIPHAFLFTGPRGLGKTSSARIVAKSVNCLSREGIEPCNKCEVCKSITEGSHIDIIEIDGASNRGVDEIRSLREKVRFSPSELSKKVYIIDEVHMLTTEAFNALLKTLEEPPSHVMFILATTEAHKVPQTILSRAFLVKFENPTDEEIINSLKRIAEGESLKVSDDVYKSLTRFADGSFRDAAKTLEELAFNSKGEIDKDLIEKVYHSGSLEKQSEELLEQFYKKDMKKGLSVIAEIASNTSDFRMIIENMVENLRQDVLSGNSRLSSVESKKILSLLNEAYQNIKISVLPQLPLEIAVMEWCSSEQVESSKYQVSSIKSKEKTNDKKLDVKNDNQSSVNSNQSIGKDDFLKNLIGLVHEESRQVAAFLRSCTESKIDGSTLTLKTPYSLHADRLSKEEFSSLIIKKAQEVNEKIKELKVSTSS